MGVNDPIAQAHFAIDKINVASIGNVVSQLHIHVIGRRRDDAYWPDVVWGRSFEKTRDASQTGLITEQFMAYLNSAGSLENTTDI